MSCSTKFITLFLLLIGVLVCTPAARKLISTGTDFGAGINGSGDADGEINGGADGGFGDVVGAGAGGGGGGLGFGLGVGGAGGLP
ncbi:hypothetical protein QVD17_01384 [Tagetes erecta]|uniref:Uncharacterized protein n=1 Tax=Tagetes erecta TaxID=13708 RepID=A0AAD8P6Q5_TARER|nr:hypothetical protein QVD17_01384 [Tagetes erecta]